MLFLLLLVHINVEVSVWEVWTKESEIVRKEKKHSEYFKPIYLFPHYFASQQKFNAGLAVALVFSPSRALPVEAVERECLSPTRLPFPRLQNQASFNFMLNVLEKTSFPRLKLVVHPLGGGGSIKATVSISQPTRLSRRVNGRTHTFKVPLNERRKQPMPVLEIGPSAWSQM